MHNHSNAYRTASSGSVEAVAEMAARIFKF